MPVVAIPWTKYLCRVKNKVKQGNSDRTDMANIDPQDEIPEESRKSLSPMGMVKRAGVFR